MDAINTVVTAVLVIGVGILLRFSTKGQVEELKGDFRRLEARLDGFARDVNTQLHALRSDLTQLAIALGVRPQESSGG